MDVVESGGRGGDVVKVFFTHRLKSVLRPAEASDTMGVNGNEVKVRSICYDVIYGRIS